MFPGHLQLNRLKRKIPKCWEGEWKGKQTECRDSCSVDTQVPSELCTERPHTFSFPPSEAGTDRQCSATWTHTGSPSSFLKTHGDFSLWTSAWYTNIKRNSLVFTSFLSQLSLFTLQSLLIPFISPVPHSSVPSPPSHSHQSKWEKNSQEGGKRWLSHQKNKLLVLILKDYFK